MNKDISLDGVARLNHFGAILVSGVDAAAFLQSQLSSDFLALGVDQARLAGFCSAKGRLQATFVAFKRSETEVVLVCAADLLAATLKRLSMFVLRMKCQLRDISAEVPVYGLAGRSAGAIFGTLPAWRCAHSAQGAAIRLPDSRRHALGLWLPDGANNGAAPAGPVLTQDHWRWLQVCSGWPVIEAATVDLFVPQMVNLELLGGVDFKKGCYPGQEVVARSQYRGTVKRRMYLYDCGAPALAGQEVFSGVDAEQPAGVVVNAALRPAQGGSALLVSVKISDFDSGDLHLGAAAGPRLERCDLPYPIALAHSDGD